MPLRITGMNSGLDTESIITELVKAKKTKVDDKKKEQTKLQWKQDAWKELNTKLLNLYQKTVGTMRFTSAYMKKKTTASNANAVSIVTGEEAVDGVQSMKVDQLAKTGYLTGGQLSSNGSYTEDSTLSTLDPTNFGSGQSGSFSLTVNGTTTDITVNGNTKISDIVSQLKNAGVNANFDKNNQRFFISAKESGKDNDFTLTASNANGLKAMEALGITETVRSGSDTYRYYEEYANAYVAGDQAATIANLQGKVDATVAERVAAYKTDNEAIAASLTDYRDKIDQVKQNSHYPNDGRTAEEIKTELDTKQARVTTLHESIDSGTLTDAERQQAETELADLQQEVIELSKKHALVSEVEGYEAEITRLNDRKTANDQYVATDADGNVTAKDRLIQEVEDSYYAKAQQSYEILHNAGAVSVKATRVEGRNAKVTLNDA